MIPCVFLSGRCWDQKMVDVGRGMMWGSLTGPTPAERGSRTGSLVLRCDSALSSSAMPVAWDATLHGCHSTSTWLALLHAPPFSWSATRVWRWNTLMLLPYSWRPSCSAGDLIRITSSNVEDVMLIRCDVMCYDV